MYGEFFQFNGMEELAVAAAELRTAFDCVVAKGVMLPQELLDTLPAAR